MAVPFCTSASQSLRDKCLIPRMLSGPPNPCTHPDPITSLVPSQDKIVKVIVFLQVPGSIADFHWDVHSTRWLASGARLIALQTLATAYALDSGTRRDSSFYWSYFLHTLLCMVCDFDTSNQHRHLSCG